MHHWPYRCSCIRHTEEVHDGRRVYFVYLFCASILCTKLYKYSTAVVFYGRGAESAPLAFSMLVHTHVRTIILYSRGS